MSVDWHGPLPEQNFTVGRGNNSIDRIVLHTMVGWVSGADARFHNPSAQVSAHFGVRVDGSLWQWVQVTDTAYHAGQWQTNLTSIGIEHEDGGDYNGTRPDALYARSASLVAQFCREYGIPCERGSGGPGIYDHRQITATACPDALDTDRIIREAKAILTPVVTVATGPEYAVLAPASLPFDVPHEWASIYKAEGPRAGIHPEIALAQALKETARFTYTGTAQVSWNNPAGLGVTGAVGVGNQFPTKRDGVVAHLQHLLMYFAPAHTAYCSPVVDQRHYSHRGYPNDVRQLNGTWAVPGVGYGESILTYVPDAKKLLDEV